jgi:hypothetical protein
MAKTTAPLLSFGADGQLAKTVVYSSWKGIRYSRRYVVPANPRTTKQTVTRTLFKNLNTMWLYAPAMLKAPYLANAVGRPYTGLNKFVGFNVDGLDTSVPPTDYSFFRGSPGALGGLPPVSLTLTGGALQITAALTPPAVPTDWSISSVSFVLFLDQDPMSPFTGQITGMSDVSSPYSVVFTGLTAATSYVVTAFIVWTRPDGKLAYSTSLTDIESTT